MGNDKPRVPKYIPKYNAPVSKVTVAFPFSAIRINEPDDRIRELASVVLELARVLDAAVPGGTAELVERAEACRAALEA